MTTPAQIQAFQDALGLYDTIPMDVLERGFEAYDRAAWRSMDSAPKDEFILGSAFDVRTKEAHIHNMTWSEERQRWIIVCNAFWIFEPTHWRPLPTPPQEASNEHHG